LDPVCIAEASVVYRGGPLGFEQDLGNRSDALQPVHLKARHFEHRHPRKGVHGPAIAPEHDRSCLRTGNILVACFTAGQDDAGRQTLQIPLKGPADGFVEVVDVEDQPPIGRGVGTQVADMRVSA